MGPMTAVAAPRRSYGASARILGIGVGVTGLVTFAYFAVASHVLDHVAYKRVTLLWSILFVVSAVIYRPVEQLLSRSIAERGHAPSLRAPLLIQAGLAGMFLVVAIVFRRPLEDHVFDGSGALWAVLVVAGLAYGASYFARGWLAGHQRFGLYGALVFLESTSRFAFALAAAVGITHGQVAVALGMAAAPVLSLSVLPWAIRHQVRRAEPPPEGATELGLRGGSGFAGAVLGIQLAEQTLVNGAVIVTDATATNPALAGFVFNVLLIVRAPLLLFQAIQTSLLPHLAGGGDARRAIRVTVLAITAFAAAVAVGLLAVGPPVMKLVFGPGFDYPRLGLVLVGLGMGFHLSAGALNQVALARGRAGHAAAAWLLCAVLFVGWVAAPVMSDVLLRAEIGYLGASGVLAGLLYGLFRRDS